MVFLHLKPIYNGELSNQDLEYDPNLGFLRFNFLFISGWVFFRTHKQEAEYGRTGVKNHDWTVYRFFFFLPSNGCVISIQKKSEI